MTSVQRARLSVVTVAVALLVGLIAGVLPASADPVPRPPPAPKSPPTADQIFARLVDAEQRVTDARIRLRDAEQSSAEAAKTAQKDHAEAVASERAFERADQALAHQRELWRRLTARAYVGGSGADASQLDDLLKGEIHDRAGQAVVLFGQVVNRHLDRMRAAAADRVKALARMQVAAAHAPRTQDLATSRARLRADAQDRLERAVASRAQVRTAIRRAAVLPQPQGSLTTPLLGLPRLTPADLASWFTATQHRAQTKVPIQFLAAWFIDEGRREGVRGDIAFAQAVLETGGFTNRDSVMVNNYAGIGHCDTCPAGYAFKTPQLGVRAQIQLLKSYALKKPAYVDPLVDKRLHGPAGCCPTWGDLTKRWATAPTYGPRIMAIYTDLMEFALRRHAALLPPG